MEPAAARARCFLTRMSLGAPEVDHIARVLLRRYGVVFRKLLERESGLPPWRELFYVYRRMEARGEIRGGRFVSGFAGEQFALPGGGGSAQGRFTRRVGGPGVDFGDRSVEPGGHRHGWRTCAGDCEESRPVRAGRPDRRAGRRRGAVPERSAGSFAVAHSQSARSTPRNAGAGGCTRAGALDTETPARGRSS